MKRRLASASLALNAYRGKWRARTRQLFSLPDIGRSPYAVVSDPASRKVFKAVAPLAGCSWSPPASIRKAMVRSKAPRSRRVVAVVRLTLGAALSATVPSRETAPQRPAGRSDVGVPSLPAPGPALELAPGALLGADQAITSLTPRPHGQRELVMASVLIRECPR